MLQCQIRVPYIIVEGWSVPWLLPGGRWRIISQLPQSVWLKIKSIYQQARNFILGNEDPINFVALSRWRNFRKRLLSRKELGSRRKEGRKTRERGGVIYCPYIGGGAEFKAGLRSPRVKRATEWRKILLVKGGFLLLGSLKNSNHHVKLTSTWYHLRGARGGIDI